MNTEQSAVEQPIKRGEFLRSLGLSSGALMALYCMGTGALSSCSSKSDDSVTPGTTTGTGGTNTSTGFTGNASTAKGAINFTLDLTDTNYKDLKTEGKFVAVGDIVVANAKGGKLVAIGRICTHEGGNLSYQLAPDNFVCDLHGGVFGTNGAVQAGPPTRAVKAYKTTLSSNGNSLQVSE